jgi:N-acetylglutamate synthase-like GNAT family acetyltransferase
MITIRPAVSKDAHAIRHLIFTVGINPTSLSWRRFLVALDENGILVGCGQVKPHSDGSRELASIAVDSAWRNQGIASQIILRLMDEYHPPLYLTCRASLEQFYNQFGFHTIAEIEMPPYFRRIHRLSTRMHRLRILPQPILVLHYPVI